MRLIQGGRGPALGAAAAAWLAANVHARVEAVLPNPASPDQPVGGIDYTVTFCLDWIPEGTTADHPELEALLTDLTRESYEQLGGVSEPVIVEVELGTADVIVADVLAETLFDALDDRSQLLADMYPMLFLPGDLDPDLSDRLSNAGAGYAVLVEQISLLSAWQDYPALASVGMGLALTELGRGCSFAAMSNKVGSIESGVATDLGFELWRADLRVLGLGLTTLHERITSLTRSG